LILFEKIFPHLQQDVSMQESQLFTDYRKRQGLTQQQAADLAMISRRQVQKIERGDCVGANSRLALAEALGIPSSDRLIGSKRLELDPVSRSIAKSDALLDPPSHLETSPPGVSESTDFDCRMSAAEVEFCIRRMRKSWMQHLERSFDESAETKELQFVAHQRLNENLEAYVARYMDLWHHMPDVIQISSVKGQKTGLSIVLPVSVYAYRELRAGERSFMEIGVEDLEQGSGCLLIDSLVEFDDAPRRKWFDVTSSLRDAIVWQVILLAGHPLPEDLRILSFGASSTNAKRLQASGFIETGEPMKDYGYALYEFARNNSDLDEIHNRCETGMYFANLLGSVLSESAVIGAGIRMRRAAVMGTMQLMQNVAQFRKSRAG
jgi:transcriptional regulator with XRE-family HTH domain